MSAFRYNLYLILHRINLGRWDPWIILTLAITIFGFVLRIYDLGAQSLWYDEGYTINAALAMLDRGLPILPSGYFYSRGILNTGLTALSIGAFGASEAAARLPSVLFGTLTIPLSFFFARRIGGKWLGLVTAFLVAFSVLEIAWSRQARMYQELQFFYVLSLFFFYQFTIKNTDRCLILTIMATAGAILSHEFGFSLVLIYLSYLFAINIKGIKRLFSRFQFLNSQNILFALSIIVLLILSEVFFSIISTVWNTRMNYLGNYLLYLRQTIPVIFLLAPAGAVLFLFKEYKPALLLVLAIIIPAYFICFHMELLGFRYIYFILPVFFTFFAYFVTYLPSLIAGKNFRFATNCAMAVTLLGVIIFTSGFNFLPQKTYYLDNTAPQPDFKHAYNFINENLDDNDTIIDTWPAVGSYYLKKPPDYWLEFNITGTRKDYSAGDDKTRELYTYIPIIRNRQALEAVVDQNPSGWLVIDCLAQARLPSETILFIEETLDYHEEGSLSTIGGDIKVYGWVR
ncbi:glycosyltransferase family 39 protein [Chloroflexota bacterium]